MKSNIICALFFALILLVTPAAMAQESPAAPGTGTVEDLAPPATAAPAADAAAAQAPAAPAGGSGLLTSTGLPSSGLDMFWALGAFILVMVLLYLTLKALGRMGRFRGVKGRQSVFELRGIQPLDNRKYLAAVEVEGRLIVVGVTPDRITPVAHWFLDDEEDGLNFGSVSLGPDPGPSLDVKLPEEDDSPLDISVADQARDPRKK